MTCRDSHRADRERSLAAKARQPGSIAGRLIGLRCKTQQVGVRWVGGKQRFKYFQRGALLLCGNKDYGKVVPGKGLLRKQSGKFLENRNGFCRLPRLNQAIAVGSQRFWMSVDGIGTQDELLDRCRAISLLLLQVGQHFMRRLIPRVGFQYLFQQWNGTHILRGVKQLHRSLQSRRVVR